MTDPILPTDIERAAQRWHDEQVDADPEHEQSSCWCCCWSCDPDAEPSHPNPYYLAAQAAMRSQI